MEFLDTTYYGNTIQQWLISLSIILFVVLLGKVVYWIFSKTVKAFTRKTKTKLDDIIVDLIEEPIVFMLMASGIWFAFTLLTLPEAFSSAINNSLNILIAILVGWLLVRLFDALYEGILQPWSEKTENDLDDQLLPILRKGVRLIIWLMAIIIGLNNAGYNVGALLAGLGIGGLAFALAAKDTVSNIFGGFTIFADQPFRINDRVQIDGYDGTIIEIGVRSTRLKTLAGRIVTIPNSTFTDAPVENVSREPSRKIILDLGLTYDTSADNMELAMQALKDINQNNAHTEEKTIVSFNGFGDFAMNIMFIYYIKSGESIADTQTEINLEILRQFNSKGLEFAFPTQTLYNIEAS
ncbi:hypothetical protein MNBD_GAMMA21-1512 [hydrothermal vent metagenome]|uniref:Potassium efflux system KefA protein / Small-conductance mechanosensitive channel n=1 Tax=hydrothermal vent metagenome TaxID=652676 RepID=A0A3B0ZQ21_9ZZZZ